MGIFNTKKHLTMVFVLLTVFSLTTYAQQRSVQGTVTSASDGSTLPGVTVVVKDYENVGTVTDFEGRFSLNLPESASALVFSFIGMESQTVAIGNAGQINVLLEASTSSLDEVVVTALGISRDVRSIGFSSQELGEEALSASRESSISSYLTGKVSGVQISKAAGGAGSSTNVVIRGYGSISGNNQPLWVVDG